MPDIPPRLRMQFTERSNDYRANLQFCCDHYRSVSDVCRRLKINRQQFDRYLAGLAIPSRHNHKKISDFFGLEDEELFVSHKRFVSSFKKARSDRGADTIDIGAFAGLLRSMSGLAASQLSEYEGFYFKYFYTFTNSQQIKRELVHWRHRNGTFVASIKQRDLGEDETTGSLFRFISYRGNVGHLGDRLFTIDTHASGHEIAMTLLYPKGRLLKRLDGLMLCVGLGSARPIGAARVAMEFLGTEIDVRAAFHKLGTFELDDPAVPASIKRAIRNDIDPEENLFFSRL